jgi:MOSC domain-containing protein YiiM
MKAQDKEMNSGRILAVSISDVKGVPKENIHSAQVVLEWGLQGDAHGGDWHRQVSLLAMESIEKMRQRGLSVKPGDFAENLTTEGMDLTKLMPGNRLKVGRKVLLEVTQIGKSCHKGCAIFEKVGHCIMPVEGIFARILRGGTVKVGDPIFVEKDVEV